MSFSPSGIVTLLTDFGTADPYVAAMKGVLLGVESRLSVVDASHAVPPQRVATAAWLLRHYAWEYPEGTVHVVVVDPGVGSAREAVVIEAGGQLFVGPNNGFAALALGDRPHRAWRIDPERLGLEGISHTFHGRDLFAPTAGRLAAGRLSPDGVGPATVLVPGAVPPARRVGLEWHGQVVHVDRFGNVITSLSRAEVAPEEVAWVEVRGRRIEERVDFYAAAAEGRLVVLFGSGGHLEISRVNGDAAAELGAAAGDAVICGTAGSPGDG
jgi:S-adenosylmethionine hydrolase